MTTRVVFIQAPAALAGAVEDVLTAYFGETVTLPINIGPATPGDVVTHKGASFAVMPLADADIVDAMPDNTGSPPDDDTNGDPIGWGQNGLLTALQAKAAAAAMGVARSNDADANPLQFANGILAGMNRTVIEPEI